MNKTNYLTKAAIIAALYIVLSLISSAVGLASGPIQVRISEALCVLPCFTSAAIPGVFLGCFFSNILLGGVVLDVVFGSICTLLGAILTYYLRNHRPLSVLPPIIINSVVIPFVLIEAYGMEQLYIYLVLSIGIGEILSCGVFGQLLFGIIISSPLKQYVEDKKTP